MSFNNTNDYLIRRVILFCDNRSISINIVVRKILQKCPQCKILLLVRQQQRGSPPPLPPHCVVLYLNNPLSILAGLNLIRRFRRMRFDLIVINKHQLTLKILLEMLLMWPRGFIFFRGEMEYISMQKMTRLELLAWLLWKRQKITSFLIAIMPLLIMLCQIPLLLLCRQRWQGKKKILATIFKNIIRGPLADSPWLFMWLQVAMVLTFIFGGRKKKQWPQRILVIRIDHIGDNINTIPLVRALRSDCPDARISMLCDSSAFIWENCPYIDEVLIYKTNNPRINRGNKRLRWLFRPFTFYPQLRHRSFDLVVDPVGRTETHILSYLCISARRISNNYYPYTLYDIEVPLRNYEADTHEIVRALALWRSESKVTDEDTRLESWLFPDDLHNADIMFSSGGIAVGERIFGIHPGAMSALRLWPIERYAQISHFLQQNYSLRVVYFEPPGMEAATAAFIQEVRSLGSSAVVLRAKDLKNLMAMISRLELFLCVDSGPLHLAAAVNTPTVAIFGPGEYWRWQPLHKRSAIVRKPLDCSPCSQDQCVKPSCMLNIMVDDVLAACEKVLSQKQNTNKC